MTRREFLSLLATLDAYPLHAARLIEAVPLTSREWPRRRRQILSSMEMVMGPLPRRRKTALKTEEVERADLPNLRRTKITFDGGQGDRVPAYLLVPDNLSNPAPAVLCLHQTARVGKGEPAGLGSNANLHYAQELAERGYVTIAPDYPNFGDYQFDPFQHGFVSATMKGIWNHMRAVDVLQSLPVVAPKRIGCIGHSLGGHNTLFVGAFDRRIRAMVTSCGFTSFKKYKGGDLTGWSHKGYMPRIATKFGKDPARMPFDFSDVLSVLAPRPVFINAPLHDSNFEVSGVRDCVEAARAVYSQVFHAADRLVAIYPDAGHEFPLAARQVAYQFLDKWLKPQ